MPSAVRESPTASPCGAEPEGPRISPEFVPDLVSVIVPTYNRRRLVLETLESVIAQTWRPIELIVVDDGSTDGTAEVVGAWSRALPSDRREGVTIELVRQRNGGAPRARNRGLAVSRGEFIQFLDSDDLLHQEKFRAQVEALRADPEAAYAYSSWSRFTDPARLDRRWFRGSPKARELVHYLNGCNLHTMAGIYRRHACIAIGPWNAGLRRLQDTEYNLRLLLLGELVMFVPGIYAFYRQHAYDRIVSAIDGTREHIEATQVLTDLVASRGLMTASVSEGVARMHYMVCVHAARADRLELAREACALARPYAKSRSRRLKLAIVDRLCRAGVPGIVRRAYFRHVHLVRMLTGLGIRRSLWQR